LNSLLDLDKGDQQGAGPSLDEIDMERGAPAPSRSHDDVARMAAAYMRDSGIAIREIPISERKPPQTGHVTAKVVAKNEAHVAFATGTNSFFITAATSLTREVQVGGRLSLGFHQDRASVDNGRNLGR
jgi:hypothetical protein